MVLIHAPAPLAVNCLDSVLWSTAQRGHGRAAVWVAVVATLTSLCARTQETARGPSTPLFYAGPAFGSAWAVHALCVLVRPALHPAEAEPNC